jgi:hypothetical protein
MEFHQCINLKSSTEFGIALEVRDAQIWLFWHQYKINKFLRTTGAKIGILGPRQERVNSLTGNYVLAGRKIVLFGRYVCDLYVGIVQFILREK